MTDHFKIHRHTDENGINICDVDFRHGQTAKTEGETEKKKRLILI